MTLDRVVQATVQIRCGGEPVGSGFRFLEDDVVVTCAHNLQHVGDDVPITAFSEPGAETELELVDVSPAPEIGGFDYALLRAAGAFPNNPVVLEPATAAPSRGTEVVFAGYPYNVSETLLHTAIVSGPHPHGFYIDGAVNLGNSGGPIVDRDSGAVVGIVTQSKLYEDRQLVDLIDNLTGVHSNLLRIQEVHRTTVNSVDVESLAIDAVQDLQEVLDLLTENLCSGIGVGFEIEPLVDGLSDL